MAYNGWKRILSASLMFLCLLLFSSYATANVYDAGDILVALTNGTVQVRAVDGTLKATLSGPIQGPAEGLGFDAQGNVYVSYWWTADKSSGNTVAKFQPDGTFAGPFGSDYFCNPSGIVVDATGNVYVGESNCSGNILKFGSNGNLIQTFDPVFENGGA